jgi:integrase
LSSKLIEVLTDLNILRILLEKRQGAKMAGHIRAKGKCPICGKPFAEIRKIGFLCLEHQTVPKRFYVDLPWQGQRIRVFSDKTGQVLDSYDRAEKLSDRIGEELEDHTFDPSNYVTAEASKFYAQNLLDRFEKDKIDSIAPSYKKDYRRMIRIAKEFFRKTDVREIRKVNVIDFQKYCREAFSWKEKTLKNSMDLFKVFMNWLKNDLEIITKVPRFPDIDVPEPAVRWIHSEDQVKLYELVVDGDKPIIAFLMLHGCRPGEARAIKCKDVSLNTQSINVHATFSRNIYMERRKGKKSKPYVMAIHPEMMEYVAARVRGSHPEAFLFINAKNGQAYSEQKIKRVWKEVKAKGNISGLRLYDASRHSVASQLVNSGVSLFQVSKILGHSSTKMTEKYSHANLESLKVQLSKLSLRKATTVTRLSPPKKDDKNW